MNRIARITSFAAAGCLAGTIALADCQSELDSFLASVGQGDPGMAEADSTTIDSLEPSTGQDAAAGTAETGSLEGDLAELEAQNEALAREMEKTDSDAQVEDGGLDDRSAAIQQARDALAAGDEEGCMSALERARGL